MYNIKMDFKILVVDWSNWMESIKNNWRVLTNVAWNFHKKWGQLTLENYVLPFEYIQA